eukprot:1635275-Rhodomonas_salina.1
MAMLPELTEETLQRWRLWMVRYMCGWGAECQQNRPSEAMLETAIHNLETHMTVAGLQEVPLCSTLCC